MSNMGYCRFQNTVKDLQDCYEHMDDSDLSPEEQEARKWMIKMCGDIATDYEEET